VNCELRELILLLGFCFVAYLKTNRLQNKESVPNPVHKAHSSREWKGWDELMVNIYQLTHRKARFYVHLCTSVNIYKGLGEILYSKAISNHSGL
jgi:hypothetical protein